MQPWPSLSLSLSLALLQSSSSLERERSNLRSAFLSLSLFHSFTQQHAMGIYVYVHVGIWERPPAERKSKKIVETDHHLRGDGAGKNNAAAERNSYTSRAQKMYNWLVIICSVGRGRGGQSRRPIERLVFSIYICCTSVGCEISRHTRASDEEWDARLFQLATLARRARYSTTTRYTQREKDREKRWLLARCSFFSPFYLFFSFSLFFTFYLDQLALRRLSFLSFKIYDGYIL